MSVGDYFGHPLNKFTRESDDTFVLPDCCLGVEVEAERSRWLELKHWKTVEDGSLRNDGHEYVFKEPLFGQDITNAFDELIEGLGGRYEASSRTSIHMHLDVRDLEEHQLYNLFVLYLIFEKAIFKFAGPTRTNSHFCVPFYKANSDCKAWNVPFSVNKDLGYFVENVASKYYALNFAALRRFGSVEFRHSLLNLNKHYLIDWANVLFSLKKYAIHLDPKLSLPEYISETGPEEFFFEVFGDELGRKLLYPDAVVEMYDGIRLSQMAVFGNNFPLVEDYYLGMKSDYVPPMIKTVLDKRREAVSEWVKIAKAADNEEEEF